VVRRCLGGTGLRSLCVARAFCRGALFRNRSDERVHDTNPAVVLPVVQVLRDQSVSP
jgi:hypothetical protein